MGYDRETLLRLQREPKRSHSLSTLHLCPVSSAGKNSILVLGRLETSRDRRAVLNHEVEFHAHVINISVKSLLVHQFRETCVRERRIVQMEVLDFVVEVCQIMVRGAVDVESRDKIQAVNHLNGTLNGRHLEIGQYNKMDERPERLDDAHSVAEECE